MASTKYRVEKFNSKINLFLAKKDEKSFDSAMSLQEWKEMDVKATGTIRLNLSDKVIHNMIDEEKAEIRVFIWQKI